MHTRSALLFWPSSATPAPLSATYSSSSSGKGSTAVNDSCQQRNFLVGWNVRDFTIVVAAVVSASSAQQVQAAVSEMHSRVQKLSFSEVELPSAPALTIVGICNTAAGISSSSTTADKALQELRASTNAFIELEYNVGSSNNNNNSGDNTEQLPTMRSLYTSGIKFDAALHLLTYDAHLFDRRRVPLPFSPLVRLEVSDVEDILAGKSASRVLRGAKSVLEGPFLPPHVLNLMPPLHPRHLAPRSVVQQQQYATTTTNTPNNSFAGAPSSSSSSTPVRAAAASAAAASDDVVELDIKTLDPSVPPRLTFPTANSLTDFSCCKSCLSGAAYVQHRLYTGEPDLYPSDKSTRKKLWLKFDEFTVSVAGLVQPLMLLTLVPVSWLAGFSYTGAITEYKLRELINALALIRGETSTCGLHPVMPHTLCGLKGERRTCLMAFLARQVVGDIFLGIGLFWLLMISSPFFTMATSAPFFASRTSNCTAAAASAAGGCGSSSSSSKNVFYVMQDFAWYGLHGMHVGYFEWFHGYPAGFKMNADLNEVLCMLCFKTMELFAAVVTQLSQYVLIYRTAYTVLLFSSLGGASFALSWAADCCLVATMHIRLLYHVVAFFYHGLTTVTSSLLLLMRGKKQNPRKNRVDDASFELDEVVLGTMACTAFAFLVPTVALYYFYLACARTVIWVLQESIRGIAVLCCNVPIYPAFLWLSRRKQWVLTGGVVLKNARPGGGGGGTSGDNDDSLVADLAFLPLPFVAVFRELGLLVRLLFAGTFSPGRIVRFIWTADSGSKPTVDVPNIVLRHLKRDPARPSLVREN